MTLMSFDPPPVTSARPDYLTVDEALEHLTISRPTLYRWLKLGMPSHQPVPGGRRLFDPAEIDAWLKVRCTSPSPGQVA
jgi:excisionase family DNA binding protein